MPVKTRSRGKTKQPASSKSTSNSINSTPKSKSKSSKSKSNTNSRQSSSKKKQTRKVRKNELNETKEEIDSIETKSVENNENISRNSNLQSKRSFSNDIETDNKELEKTDATADIEMNKSKNNNDNSNETDENGEIIDWGDWSWGCCDGTDRTLDENESIQCDDKLNKKCQLFYHFDCLKKNNGYSQRDIDTMCLPNGHFDCPKCEDIMKNDENKEKDNNNNKNDEKNLANKVSELTLEKPNNQDNSLKSSSPPKMSNNSNNDNNNESLNDGKEESDIEMSKTDNNNNNNNNNDSTASNLGRSQRNRNNVNYVESDLSSDGSDSDGSESDDEQDLSHVFGNDLTEEEKKRLKERLNKVQAQAKNYDKEKRKAEIDEIKLLFEYECGNPSNVTDEFAAFSIDFCDKQQIEWRNRIVSDPAFYQLLREMFEQKLESAKNDANNNNSNNNASNGGNSGNNSKKNKKRNRNGNDSDFEWDPTAHGGLSSDESEYFDSAASDYYSTDSGSDYCPDAASRRKKQNKKRKKRINNDNMIPSDDDKDYALDCDTEEARQRRAKRRVKFGGKKGYNMDGKKRCSRLILNDALTELVKALKKGKKNKNKNSGAGTSSENNNSDKSGQNSPAKDGETSPKSNEKNKSKSSSKSPKNGKKKSKNSANKGDEDEEMTNENNNSNEEDSDNGNDGDDENATEDKDWTAVDWDQFDFDSVPRETLHAIGWSDARIEAFRDRKINPNKYYYRFNDYPEKQSNGKWSQEEHNKFMERAKEVGVNERWGVFSQAVPGRVGYQCSNYWRDLMKNGYVKDPNYVVNGRSLSFRKHVPSTKKWQELKLYGFQVVRDNSGVFGTQAELPKRHPKAPSEEFIEKARKLIVNNHRAKKNASPKSKSKKTTKSKAKGKNKSKNGDEEQANDEDIEMAGNDNNNNNNNSNNSNEISNSNSNNNSNNGSNDESGNNSGNGTKRKTRKRKASDYMVDDSDAAENDGNDEESEEPPKKKRRMNNNKSKGKGRGRGKGRRKKTDDDEEYRVKESGMTAAQLRDLETNPIPDFTDHMTGCPVIQPAMDPCGHVLGYQTWTRILSGSKGGAKNTCPFTKKKVTRRALVKLTKDNYDEYKDKIVKLGNEMEIDNNQEPNSGENNENSENNENNDKTEENEKTKTKTKAKSKTKSKSKSKK